MKNADQEAMLKTTPGLDPSLFHAITLRLASEAGIEPRSLDLARVRWVVEDRCRKLRLPPQAYADYLRTVPSEFDCLIDALTIQETRFFRDPTVFDEIQACLPNLLARFPEPLRILSAPCSTGQEAYSVAALLYHSGLPSARFSIDAFDISTAALATAQRGIYPDANLDNVSNELQAACGSLLHGHFHIHKQLRDCIRFERRNLADPNVLGIQPQYHLILCRNLFIYLTPQARATLVQSLAQALIPGGRLILGTADWIPELDRLFVPLQPPASFAFAHGGQTDPHPGRQKISDRVAQPSSRFNRAASPAILSRTIPPPSIPPTSAPLSEEENRKSSAAEFFRRAQQHQQQGNLHQAERRCRQALYLAPGFVAALELLQQLWQSHPNPRLQQALHARIQRIQTNDKSQRT
jgi:chemotaxis protein methyltransferase WspC